MSNSNGLHLIISWLNFIDEKTQRKIRNGEIIKKHCRLGGKVFYISWGIQGLLLFGLFCYTILPVCGYQAVD